MQYLGKVAIMGEERGIFGSLGQPPTDLCLADQLVLGPVASLPVAWSWNLNPAVSLPLILTPLWDLN